MNNSRFQADSLCVLTVVSFALFLSFVETTRAQNLSCNHLFNQTDVFFRLISILHSDEKNSMSLYEQTEAVFLIFRLTSL